MTKLYVLHPYLALKKGEESYYNRQNTNEKNETDLWHIANLIINYRDTEKSKRQEISNRHRPVFDAMIQMARINDNFRLTALLNQEDEAAIGPPAAMASDLPLCILSPHSLDDATRGCRPFVRPPPLIVSPGIRT